MAKHKVEQKKRSVDDVADYLYDNGVILIDFEIDEQTIQPAVMQLLSYHIDPDFTKNVQIIINSRGGCTYATFGFINLMATVKNPITTMGFGLVASGAAMIFAAGDRRLLSPDSCVMIHEAWGTARGRHHDIQTEAEQWRKEHDLIIDHYLRHSRYKTVEDVKKHLLVPRTDNWLSPREMVAHGLCEGVTKRHKKSPAP